MPGRRKYNKRSRRRRKPNPNRGILQLKTPLRLRYSTNVNLDPPAGLTAQHVFSAIGMYDPDIGGIGHQPRGFDQIMKLYNYYKVTSATIRVSFCNTTDTANAYQCAIALRDDQGAYTSPDDVNECRNLVRGVAGRAGGGGQDVTLTKRYNARSWYRQQSNDDQLRGTDAANPNLKTSFHVTAYASNLGNPLPIYCSVTIDYNAIFTEPNQPAAS